MFDSFALVFQPLAIKQFNLLLVVYLVAITAEAMSGALAAGRRNMDFFGVKIDEKRNAEVKGMPADVASDSSDVRILVIQTNEELAIARMSYGALLRRSGSPSKD